MQNFNIVTVLRGERENMFEFAQAVGQDTQKKAMASRSQSVLNNVWEHWGVVSYFVL